MYPLFEYFENWCQDENRHGDFFTAVLKAQPQLVNDLPAKLWSRFFCLSVYITMYLNDHSRDAFYSSLGLDTKRFNQHVIIETNNSTARVFPSVPDVENPAFFQKMDALVGYNDKISEIGRMEIYAPVKAVLRLPYLERMVANIFQIFIMTPKESGSVDLADPEAQAQLMY